MVVNVDCVTTASAKAAELDGGTHRFSFSFYLPPSIPSSFEGKLGYVRYTAEAKMVRPWKFDHVTRSAFTVISLVDLNLEPAIFKVNAFISILDNFISDVKPRGELP